MTFCKHCGSQIEDNAAFCGVCGQAQNAAEPQAPVYQAPVQPTYQAPVQNPYGQPVQPGFQQNVYGQPAYQQPVQVNKASMVLGKGLGVAAMVLGIISLVLFCVWYLAIPCAIVGAALGGVAQSKAKAAGVKNGMAVAGITCSCIALGVAILFLLLGIIGLASIGAFA